MAPRPHRNGESDKATVMISLISAVMKTKAREGDSDRGKEAILDTAIGEVWEKRGIALSEGLGRDYSRQKVRRL